MTRYFQFVSVDDPRSRYLAAWRGGSAILVLIGHAFQVFHRDAAPVWGVLATCSVLIFFGLSGFFIHKALAKSMERGGVAQFVAGRVNRIVPPFAVAMLLVVLLWWLAPLVFATGSRAYAFPTARPEFSLDGLWPSLVLLNGFAGPTVSANGPLWSLSFEIWYYVAALLLGVAVLRGRVWPIAVMLVLLLGLTALNRSFAMFGSIWALGFALSALHGMGRIPKILESPFLILAAAMVVAASVEAFRGALPVAQMSVGLWFVVHMARLLRGATPLPTGPLEWTSHFSYALYVTHFPLMLFAYGATGERSWLMVPTAIVIFAAVASFGRRLETTRLVGHRPMLQRAAADHPAP